MIMSSTPADPSGLLSPHLMRQSQFSSQVCYLPCSSRRQPRFNLHPFTRQHLQASPNPCHQPVHHLPSQTHVSGRLGHAGPHHQDQSGGLDRLFRKWPASTLTSEHMHHSLKLSRSHQGTVRRWADQSYQLVDFRRAIGLKYVIHYAYEVRFDLHRTSFPIGAKISHLL
ncbi:hypothetical protein PCPL58_p5028 (plasmid) [Pseudomonas cerasi]|nr:hypothetical protein PCPL58_p5028 [Pseudomonas cerasi]